MTSWADEIDDTEPMPRPSEQWVGNNKITTEFTTDEETDKRIKIVRTYKVEKKLVSKAIAKRKALPKFGMSRDHGPGPNPQTTVVTEEIEMNFIANKEEADREPGEESLKVRVKVLAVRVVLTRTRLEVPEPQGEGEVPGVNTSHLAPGQQEVDPAVESRCPKEKETKTPPPFESPTLARMLWKVTSKISSATSEPLPESTWPRTR